MELSRDEKDYCQKEGSCIACHERARHKSAMWCREGDGHYVPFDKNGNKRKLCPVHKRLLEWTEYCEPCMKKKARADATKDARYRSQWEQQVIDTDLRKRASDREKYEAIAYPRPLTERPLLVPHKDHPDYGKPILDENGKPLFQTPERQCVMKGCDHELISPGLLPEDLRKEVTCGQHNDEERKTSTRRGPKGINRQKIQRFLRKRPDALTDGERQKIERLLSATPPTRRELKRRILQKYFTAEQRKQIIPQHITRDAWRVYFKWKTKNGTTSTECYQLRDLY